MSRGLFRGTVVALLVAGACHAAPVAGLVPSPCIGDCDQDGRVLITDLIVAVKVVLGEAPVADCPSIFCADGPPLPCLVAAVDEAMRDRCQAGGEPCGDVTCNPGLVCCNPLLGICTPPGEICIF